MKQFLLFIFVLFCTLVNAQLIEGELIEDGRKILNKPVYIVEGMKDGWAKYDLSVDITGKVTGVELVESNLKSTPATTIIRNHVKKFTFEAGTAYPQYHHVIVKITMVKGNVESPQINLD